MKKREIKELAKLLVANDKIAPKTAEYILNNLSKKDLKDLLFSLRVEGQKRRVVIKTSEEIDDSTKMQLEERFDGKDIVWEEDENLGGGIIIEDADDTMDFSMRSLIKKTVDELKSN